MDQLVFANLKKKSCRESDVGCLWFFCDHKFLLRFRWLIKKNKILYEHFDKFHYNFILLITCLEEEEEEEV